MTLWLALALTAFALTVVASTAAGAYFGLDRVEKVRPSKRRPALLAEFFGTPTWCAARSACARPRGVSFGT